MAADAAARAARALSRLDVRTKSLNRVEEMMRRAESLPRNVVLGIVAYAGRELRPMVVGFIQRNFAASGIKSRTGKLARALTRIVVSGTLGRGGLPVLRIEIPGGESPYRAGGKSSDFYEVAASLNYGAVRAGMQTRSSVDLPTGRVGGPRRVSAVGARAKRTIKAHALGRAASGRAIAAIERGRSTRREMGGHRIVGGYNVGGKAAETAGSVKLGGGAVVIKPRQFFTLTPSQRRQVAAEFERLVMTSLGNWIAHRT